MQAEKEARGCAIRAWPYLQIPRPRPRWNWQMISMLISLIVTLLLPYSLVNNCKSIDV